MLVLSLVPHDLIDEGPFLNHLYNLYQVYVKNMIKREKVV